MQRARRFVGLRTPTLSRHPIADPAYTPTDLGLDRINPVVEKLDRSLGLGLRRLRLRDNACHGVPARLPKE
jgi:hypothetical protein